MKLKKSNIFFALILAVFLFILFFGGNGIIHSQNIAKKTAALTKENNSLIILKSDLNGQTISLLLKGYAMENIALNKFGMIITGSTFYRINN
ncbi:MAG: septum formation initiator family protein [Psittacicella sp.]